MTVAGDHPWEEFWEELGGLLKCHLSVSQVKRIYEVCLKEKLLTIFVQNLACSVNNCLTSILDSYAQLVRGEEGSCFIRSGYSSTFGH